MDRGRKPNCHFHKIITLFLHESKSIAVIFVILVIYFRSCRCTWQLKISWYTLCHAVFNYYFFLTTILKFKYGFPSMSQP